MKLSLKDPTGSKGDCVEYTFRSTSIEWIGAKNNNAGQVDIYLDGQLVRRDLNLYANRKNHKQVLYRNTNLEDTEHLIKIVCTDAKNKKSNNTYVVVDGFSHPNRKTEKQPLQLYINREWAFNLGWGNYNRTSKIEQNFSDTVRMRFVEHVEE